MIPAFGTSLQISDLAFAIQDQLNLLGDFLTQEVGSLNWCEAMTYARVLTDASNYLHYVANQLQPASCSTDRWLNICNVQTQEQVALLQAQFCTPPTLTNMRSYLQTNFPDIFLDIQWAPELQLGYATTDPSDFYSPTLASSSFMKTPLSYVYIYIWQPRDNQDNLLMDNATFNSQSSAFISYLQNWCPSWFSFISLNLVNRGNYDGYGNGYNGFNYNNYLDGYNVISATAGSYTIDGYNTNFHSDFGTAVNTFAFMPPLQVVDDAGELQTYYISAVDAHIQQMTTTTPIVNNITNRTYRTLGIVMDTDGMLDSGSLFDP